MQAALSDLLSLVTLPAFLSTKEARVLYLNPALRELVGLGVGTDEEDLPPTLVELGLFRNTAEFRGFVRGFSTVGRTQRIRLPATRLHRQEGQVVVNARLLGEEEMICGLLDFPKSAPAVPPTIPDAAIVENLPFFVLRVDGEGRITYGNEVARNRLLLETDAKTKEATPIGRIDAEYTERLWRGHLTAARQKGQTRYDTHFLLRDGALLPVEVVICEVRGNPVRAAVLVATDITQRRGLATKLQAANLLVEDLRYQTAREQRLLQDQLGELNDGSLIYTPASCFVKVVEKIEQVAATDSTVLISGETGTGKELVARAIHRRSHRAGRPLVTINCGALPAELIESELFGYRKGAFTGAVKDRVGRFELADKGTLFLDEIGEMPPELQTRLLRVLQEGEFTPVGGKETLYADVRIIAATNRKLEEQIRAGTFRSDLYFRLNVFPIHNPPLRDRPEDIPALVQHFINKHGRRLNSAVRKAHPDTLSKLTNYPFYGNVRELENIVERAMITSRGRLLEMDWEVTFQDPTPASVPNPAPAPSPPLAANPAGSGYALDLTFEEVQKRHIEAVLRRTNGKVSGPNGAAEILGLKAQTLFSKMRKLGVQRSS